MRRCLPGSLPFLLILSAWLRAEDVPPISADESLADTFSLVRAATYLDSASIAWQEERECGTCHTNFAHVMLRSSLDTVLAEPPTVRDYIEGIVEERWQSSGPRWDAEVVVAATTLAWNDRARSRHSGEPAASAATRAAFDRMATLQRPDGGWNWLKCGWPPMESDDHYGVTFAALGLGAAPPEVRDSDVGARMLAGIRSYLGSHPAPSLHHRAMVLWASTLVDGLIDDTARDATIAELRGRQLADGGWAVATLFDGWKEHARKDDAAPSRSAGDGYGTAFALVVLRSAGVSIEDSAIGRGVEWLRTHQRASGRWFTPSPTKDSKHFLTNAGTALAGYALALCDVVPQRSAGAPSLLVPSVDLPEWATPYERAALERPGDPKTGESLFLEHEGLHCAKCHRVSGMERAGPNLDGIGDKYTRAELVREILAPSAAIKPGFERIDLVLRDGQVISGRAERANRVVYRVIDAEGKQTDVDTSRVASASTADASLMPEDLVRSITPEQFADLVAWLATLRFGTKEGLVAGGRAIEIPHLSPEDEARFVPVHAPDLAFENPVWCGAFPGTNGDLAVVEQHSSRIWRLVRGDDADVQRFVRKELFLDLGGETWISGNQGLMCVAFHPHFESNRLYYLEHEVKEDGDVKTLVVERRAAESGLRDSGARSRRLLDVVQPAYNHNGGCIAFGPDGMLYAAFGDGGPQRDPPGHSQNPRILLGSMVRIDVDRRDPGLPYGIPPDNPYLAQHALDPAVRPETWAIGFREPWRFDFDPVTGDLWLGDVGQDALEEVAIVRRGENHGWNVREAFDDFSGEYRRDGETYVDPLFAYRHGLGFSVTGGHVYRGRRSPSFVGVYIFGDYNTRRVWGLRLAASAKEPTVESVVEIGTAPGGIASFGVDRDGELYVVTYAGTIYGLDLSRSKYSALRGTPPSE